MDGRLGFRSDPHVVAGLILYFIFDEFAVLVKYYAPKPNLIAGETHVEVVVERRTRTGKTEVKRYETILQEKNQIANVCRVRF